MPNVMLIESGALSHVRKECWKQHCDEGRGERWKIEWEQGWAEGIMDVMLPQLTRKCGTLPEELEQEVRELSLDQSETLALALLDFQTLDELRHWLKTNSN